jgi:C-terminal processing protease CtpA/Prc
MRSSCGCSRPRHLIDAKGAKQRVIVVPVAADAARNLRSVDWTWERRRRVEAASNGRFGYLHLNAMVTGDLSEFAREFYAVSTAAGLVIDVRDNSGGSVDSILIEKLVRRAWESWQARGRSRNPSMQNAFRGNLVVIANQGTYLDGEIFAEGIKRLKQGTLVGMRTAGAGVWLDNDNRLADGGIARAAPNVQIGTEGPRLIEGRGVVPDVEIDNPPHTTFDGADAQLDMAICRLGTGSCLLPHVGSQEARPDTQCSHFRRRHACAAQRRIRYLTPTWYRNLVPGLAFRNHRAWAGLSAHGAALIARIAAGTIRDSP